MKEKCENPCLFELSMEELERYQYEGWKRAGVLEAIQNKLNEDRICALTEGKR